MTKTDDKMREVFEEHLPYEIRRLVETYHLLLAPDQYREKLAEPLWRALEDALIVSFCTHARNLLEFFYHKPNGHNAVATDYADAAYVTDYLSPPRSPDPVEDMLRRKLNNQITHLTYGRTSEATEKITERERYQIMCNITDVMVLFAGHLKPGYDAKHLHLNDLYTAWRAGQAALSDAAGPTTTTFAQSYSTGPTGPTGPTAP